ncbi:monovalent cation:proton antiporter-2 (CPA2) family protein [Bdellovibrio svalbardensis]|uniref:Monovalent cation:proton antiporter-2 (CPA2) family protein n=1 Tax=Bdellovibrio svalbardensis TaxID=2972972 RepID=A0ABT6DIG8_9BACT|nr:monovalent cation:proton antiporter-2 (CPA2) family protein [Bdellovibrio svalbardensis]MDG0816302.1 monovalent cation:proton antiporter-2 (CPA2) family protein [Bdellovibrio svalbardensis]
MAHTHLLHVILFLGSSVVLVWAFQRMGLGSILGYLTAGILIGPQLSGLITDYTYTQNLSEFGVVFLLFLIGLELQPKKIWALKKTLLGFGGLQIIFCTLAFAALANFFGLSWPASWVVGFALSLSSTAFSLQSLSERKVLNTEFGRSSFAILLMQDVAAIPALAIIPSLSLNPQIIDGMPHVNWGAFLFTFTGFAIFSRTLLGPFLRQVATLRSRELFTGVTLLIVIGVAYLMERAGLSMALGAFLAGVFLSESEYRHELEADLEPFKGLLMGLFFISVGMSVNLLLILEKPLLIVCLTILYMGIKGLLIYGVGRFMKLKADASQNLSVYLVQGGEFAFVILGVGQTAKVLSLEGTQILTLIITLSMILSPFIILINDRFQQRRLVTPGEKNYDRFQADNPVIIAGFGRFGQIFGRILRTQDIGFTAIDHDPEQIELLRRFSHQVYYGDASRKELLQSAGAARAKYFIIAVDDMTVATQIATTVRQEYPHLKVYARARNRQHVFELMDLGIEHIRRETLDSSLSLTQDLLIDLGIPKARAEKMIERFRLHDELMLQEQFKVRFDQKVFLDVSRQGMQQLAQVLKEDSEKTYIEPGKELHD